MIVTEKVHEVTWYRGGPKKKTLTVQMDESDVIRMHKTLACMMNKHSMFHGDTGKPTRMLFDALNIFLNKKCECKQKPKRCSCCGLLKDDCCD